MRIQKYIAHCGVTSRRKGEEYIKEGKVKVNGKLVAKLGTKIDPNKDIVEVNNKIISLNSDSIYILVNKPEGYICSVSDNFKRPTVIDLIPKNIGRVYPVGRLDFNSKGLLLLTNDGKLTYKLTHPKYKIKKEYEVLINGVLNCENSVKFEKGILIENKITAPAKLSLIEKYGSKAKYKVIIYEGRNRQIRRMFEKIGFNVLKLKRLKLYNLTLDNLEEGKFRYLTKKEINHLKNLNVK